MKLVLSALISSAVLLTSCGKHEDNSNSNIETRKKVQKLIGGTTWTLESIVDSSNNPVSGAYKTKLFFHDEKNILEVSDSNGNVSMCGIKTGGEYFIENSSNSNEFLISSVDLNCSGIISGGIAVRVPMAIVTINGKNISVKRHTYRNLSISQGKIDPSVLLTETYIKEEATAQEIAAMRESLIQESLIQESLIQELAATQE